MIEEIPDPAPRVGGQRNYPVDIAIGVALAAAGVTVLCRFYQTGQVDNWTYYLAAATLVAFWGATYALVLLGQLVVPAIISMAKEGGSNNTEPLVPATQQAVSPLPSEPAAEDGKTTFEKRVLDTKRFVGPGGHVYETDGPAVLDILTQIARARAAGRLRSVSPTQLTALNIISRHSSGIPNAETIVADLLAWEFVKSAQDRRPHEWTDRGKLLFPSPTDRNEAVAAGGGLPATAATATTEMSGA